MRQAYENAEGLGDAGSSVSRSSSGRRRSSSAPQQPSQPAGSSTNLSRQNTRQSLLPTVNEGTQSNAVVDRETMNETIPGMPGRRRSVGNRARSVVSRFSDHSRERAESEGEYNTEFVDLLDVLGKWLDPFVGKAGTI